MKRTNRFTTGTVKSDLGSKIFQVLRLLLPKSDFARARLAQVGLHLLVLLLALAQTAFAQSKMYFTDTGQLIVRANLDGTGQQDVITSIVPDPGIALDVAGGKMYWGKDNGIHRANLNGTGVATVLSGLAEPVGDIALDLTNGKIYWMDRFKANLHRANLNGTGPQDLVTGAIDFHEGGIALDVAGGKVYWSEPERIRRANLDGTSPEDLVIFFPTDPPNFPRDVALDLSAGKLYWSEIFAFGIPNANKIRRANLNGTGAEDVITGLDEPYALALDVAGTKVYWVEGLDIFRGNFNGTSVETVTPQRRL